MIPIDLEPIWQEAVQQQIFRQLLSCMSQPGTIANLSRYLNGRSALVGVLATLLDGTVSFSDDSGLLTERDRRLLQASPTSTSSAHFVVVDAATAPASGFSPNLGMLASPEQGTTLILQGDALGTGELSLQLTGPGIANQCRVLCSGFHLEWFRHRAEWVVNFPLGVDLILVDAVRVMALPRTTQLESSAVGWVSVGAAMPSH